MNKKLIGIVLVVVVVIIAAAAMMSSSNNENGFDHENKKVNAAATTLMVTPSVFPSGWTASNVDEAGSEISGVVSGADRSFVNSGYSQTILVTLYVYDTVENAKAKYADEKADAETSYSVSSYGKCEQCFKYAISAGMSTMTQYVFQDMNVYGEIYTLSGVVKISDDLIKNIFNNLEEKIHSSAILIS